MPRKGCTKRVERQCLVCANSTFVAHLGIDLCRACAIFYRRCDSEQPRHCRTGTSRCRAGKDLNCKRCRFRLIDRHLQGIQPTRKVRRSEPAHSSSAVISQPVQLQPASTGTSASRTSLLYRLRMQYRALCHSRLMSETFLRESKPKLSMDIDRYDILPVSHERMTSGNQILITSLIEFGSTVFPEFQDFTEEEKWSISIEFFYRFRSIDGCYRANKRLPDDHDKILVSYTCYFGPDIFESFYKGFPTQPHKDVDGAVNYVKHSSMLAQDVFRGRAMLRRLFPSVEEFTALLGLMFWTIDSLQLRAEVHQIGERYRAEIMQELNGMYRDELKLDNYAARLGELLMLIQVFDVKEKYKEHFEMLRLLNVITDDTFIYKLQRE